MVVSYIRTNRNMAESRKPPYNKVPSSEWAPQHLLPMVGAPGQLSPSLSAAQETCNMGARLSRRQTQSPYNYQEERRSRRHFQNPSVLFPLGKGSSAAGISALIDTYNPLLRIFYESSSLLGGHLLEKSGHIRFYLRGPSFGLRGILGILSTP